MVTNAQLPKAGDILGGYELLDTIGAGGFSLVMRGRHLATGEVVAIKLPLVADFVEQLRREALKTPPITDGQILQIREVSLETDPPFLVMPYIEGCNLPLPAEAPEPQFIVDAFRQFREIVEVVARLHAIGIAHGDLKPGNIRLAMEGTCHLLDLGVARQQVAALQLSTLRNSCVSVTGEKIAGTLDFMAPEVMAGAAPGIPSDMYALGVVLHHLLCGRPPGFGVTPASLNPFLPPGTAGLLRNLLDLDPGKRLAGAGALLPAIDAFIKVEERCLRRKNGHARRRVFLERMKTVSRGAKALAAVLGMALVIGVAGYFAWVQRTTRIQRPELLLVVAAIPLYLAGWLSIVLGMTTLNAWILGVPGRLYKNRAGHPVWNFMMQ